MTVTNDIINIDNKPHYEIHECHDKNVITIHILA